MIHDHLKSNIRRTGRGFVNLAGGQSGTFGPEIDQSILNEFTSQMHARYSPSFIYIYYIAVDWLSPVLNDGSTVKLKRLSHRRCT